MKFGLSIWVVLSFLTIAEGQSPPVLFFDNGVVRVKGLNIGPVKVDTRLEWDKILAVYTHVSWTKKINQAVSGTCVLEDRSITFKPDFPFSPGETYHAVFNVSVFYHEFPGGKENDDTIELTFTLPRNVVVSASIEAVYPGSPTLPENLLRMHILFSQPMMPGAYEHIKLLREDGSIVDKPFLVVDQELWDADRKQFTLLFDPGRIKRTLKANLELGAPLVEGTQYKLLIDSTWRDVNGNHLAHAFTKSFVVTKPIRARLSAHVVKVSNPLAGTSDDLFVAFDRPMDRVLAAKHISVFDSKGVRVYGVAEMINDSVWRFSPHYAWQDGKYVVSLAPLVEDVCGNNFNNVFDLDMTKEKRIESTENIRIEFVCNNEIN